LPPPSNRHEAIVELFRNRPVLAAELLGDALKVSLPSFSEARVHSASFTDLNPAEYRADLVVLLLQDRPVLGIVVEAQLHVDPRKRYTWPFYSVGLRVRLSCPTCVLVVAPRADVAAWAAEPFDMGPGCRFAPQVLGPGMVPVVSDATRAAEQPELAVLSAMAHGSSLPPGRAATLALAAIASLSGVEHDRAMLYYDLIESSLSGAARKALFAMDLSKYEFQSEIVRRFIAEGRSEGRSEGRAEGRAEAIVQVLQARGLAIPEDVRERILACRDPATLDRWIARAALVPSATEVVVDKE
jgi:hypothetical protein